MSEEKHTDRPDKLTTQEFRIQKFATQTINRLRNLLGKETTEMTPVEQIEMDFYKDVANDIAEDEEG